MHDALTPLWGLEIFVMILQRFEVGIQRLINSLLDAYFYLLLGNAGHILDFLIITGV